MIVAGANRSSASSGHNAQLEKWAGWVDVLFQHLVQLHDDRAMWNELLEIVRSNTNIPDPWPFLDWISHLWATTMSVGIRRLDDTNPKSISLARLITEVGAHPEIPSRAQHRRLYAETYPGDAYMQGAADAAYDKLVGVGLDEPTSEMIDRDLVELRTSAATIRRHVNKFIAHTDEQAGLPSATFADLDAALAGATAVYQRYSRLITGSAPKDPTPRRQTDWKRAFLVPWQPNDSYLARLKAAGLVPRHDADKGRHHDAPDPT
jgi:hypothetical protein